METKPDKAVSIIECDMNVRPAVSVVAGIIGLFCSALQIKYPFVSQVDFDAPLGYKEPERQHQHQEETTVSTKLQSKCSVWCFKQFVTVNTMNVHRKKEIPALTLTWTWGSE